MTDAYGSLLAATRKLLDALAAARPPESTGEDARRLVEQACELLLPHAATERDAHSGNRPDLPGRGHPLVPPYMIDLATPGEVTGRVTLTRHHLGGGGMTHGGVLPLLFDELLGRLVSVDRPMSRTAYLNTSFRSVTPLDVELTFRVWVDREDGRKLFAKGELRRADELLVEAEGLFLILLPGQR